MPIKTTNFSWKSAALIAMTLHPIWTATASAQLQYNAPASCPSREALEDELRALSGTESDAFAQERIRIVAVGAEFLGLRNEGTPSAVSLRATDCTELVRLLATQVVSSPSARAEPTAERGTQQGGVAAQRTGLSRENGRVRVRFEGNRILSLSLSPSRDDRICDSLPCDVSVSGVEPLRLWISDSNVTDNTLMRFGTQYPNQTMGRYTTATQFEDGETYDVQRTTAVLKTLLGWGAGIVGIGGLSLFISNVSAGSPLGLEGTIIGGALVAVGVCALIYMFTLPSSHYEIVPRGRR